MYWIAARSQPPAVLGPLLGAIGISLVLAGTADFGLNTWTVRAMARDPSSPGVFRATLTAKLVLAVVIGLAWVMACLLISVESRRFLAFAILGIYLGLLIVGGTLLVPFRAAERMGLVAVAGLVEKIVALGALLVLIPFSGAGPGSFAVALSAGALAALAFAMLRLDRSHLGLEGKSPSDIWRLWKSSISFGMAGLAAQLQRADVAIVAIVAGPTASGYFGAPARLTGFLNVIPAAFTTALLPRIAQANDRRTSIREALSAGGLMMLVMTVLLLLLFVLAPLLVTVALGREYLPSVGVFRIYLVGMILASVNQPLAVYLQAEGHEHYVAVVVGGVSVLGLCIVAIGAAVGGAIGASLGFIALHLSAAVSLSIKSRLVAVGHRHLS
jgi:O-antigen/teichoic acid export membrane protein